jgi:ketosteroid isomerase-like protein
MSGENVGIVRSIYAGASSGDFRMMSAFIHPDVEAISLGGPDPQRRKGRAALADAMLGFLRLWEDFRVVAEDCRELDESRVLVLLRRSGRGKVSKIGLAELAGAEGADVLEMRDGQVIRWTFYWERQHALADLGLSEQDALADS